MMLPVKYLMPFQEQEDRHGYFLLLREIVLSRGIPLALYHDRHLLKLKIGGKS